MATPYHAFLMTHCGGQSLSDTHTHIFPSLLLPWFASSLSHNALMISFGNSGKVQSSISQISAPYSVRQTSTALPPLHQAAFRPLYLKRPSDCSFSFSCQQTNTRDWWAWFSALLWGAPLSLEGVTYQRSIFDIFDTLQVLFSWFSHCSAPRCKCAVPFYDFGLDLSLNHLL